MHDVFDLNIRPLAAAINAFDGLTVVGGCEAHRKPQSDQRTEGGWYLMFTVQRTDAGWFALEFLAWAINNDYRRGGYQVLLSPIAPPPYLNEPGQSLQFVIEGAAGVGAAALAGWLNRLRAECYVAPRSGGGIIGQHANRFGEIHGG